METHWKKSNIADWLEKYTPLPLAHPMNDGSSIDSNAYKIIAPDLIMLLDPGGQKHFEELMGLVGYFDVVLHTHLDADHIGLPTGKMHYASEDAIANFLRNREEALDRKFTISIEGKQHPVGKQCNRIIEEQLFGDIKDVSNIARELRSVMKQDTLYFKRYDSGHAVGQVIYFFNGYAFTGDIMSAHQKVESSFSRREFFGFMQDTVGKNGFVLSGHDTDYFNGVNVIR